MDDTSWYLVDDNGTCIAYEQTISPPLPIDTITSTSPLILPLDTILETNPMETLLLEEIPEQKPKVSFYHSHRVIENGHHHFIDDSTDESDGDQSIEMEKDHSMDIAEPLMVRGQQKKRKCYTNRPHRTKVLSPQQQTKHDQRLQQRVKREVNYLLKTRQKR